MTRQISNGRCNPCGEIFSKRAMAKHLKSCKQSEHEFDEDMFFPVVNCPRVETCAYRAD